MKKTPTTTTTKSTTGKTTTPNALKTYIFLGSSVTRGDGSDGWSMCEYMEEYHNLKVVKWAESGTTLANRGSNSYVQRLIDWSNTRDACHHLVVQLSTNDARVFNENRVAGNLDKMPLGTVSTSFDKEDFDDSSIIGAMEYIIAFAKEKWRCSVSFYTGTKFNNAYSDVYQQMVDATLQLKEKWGIGVLDLWNDAAMNAVSTADYDRYMVDPIHPGRAGYEEWWGPKFAEHLLGK